MAAYNPIVAVREDYLKEKEQFLKMLNRLDELSNPPCSLRYVREEHFEYNNLVRRIEQAKKRLQKYYSAYVCRDKDMEMVSRYKKTYYIRKKNHDK